ncbi:hypothetical protein GGS23DRAFT_601268 [Durotheca rogersii]|uniref:uncharacterized protein n=1 Tax=Durotheca rogersii TaxID=419775 RepID=UPI00221ECBAE|nr:uncharacterized protein GGS23DRAFT_601268 [Durotheca rogersii]KAI5856159.1 hypothetical protein GGS23DRAFT_601268 [Durotheca rogersii]
MCLRLTVHHTSRRHDTRFLSIINPVTGYTVHSPWQEPYQTLQVCDYPCVVEKIPVEEHCLWHGHCCRLHTTYLCQQDVGICAVWVKYHHFVFDEDEYHDDEHHDEHHDEHDRKIPNDLPFLGAYLRYGACLQLVPWLFKAGVELCLADTYRAQISRELAGAILDRGADAAEKRMLLESRLRHFEIVMAYARDCLGQFARLWDAETARRALPPRPGAAADPEQSAVVSELMRLDVESWAQRDVGVVPWPDYIKIWPEFRKRPFPVATDGDPSLACWTCVLVYQKLGPMPTQREIPTLSFDPNLPLLSSTSSLDSTVSGLSSPDATALSLLSPSPFRPAAPKPRWIERITPSSTHSASASPSSSATSTIHVFSALPQSKDQEGYGDESDYDGDEENDTDPSSSTGSRSDRSSRRGTSSDNVANSNSDEETRGEEENQGLPQELPEVEYAIESLVGHRPSGAGRSRAVAYLVRWAGEWSHGERQMWVHRRDIAPQFIDDYWRKRQQMRRRGVGGGRESVGADGEAMEIKKGGSIQMNVSNYTRVPSTQTWSHRQKVFQDDTRFDGHFIDPASATPIIVDPGN